MAPEQTHKTVEEGRGNRRKKEKRSWRHQTGKDQKLEESKGNRKIREMRKYRGKKFYTTRRPGKTRR